MKSLKLLLLSSTITIISILLIQPVVAKPTLNLQHLKVANEHIFNTTQAPQLYQVSFNRDALPTNPVNNLLNQHSKQLKYQLSDQLTLTVKRTASEQRSRSQENSVLNSNVFFETSMAFNDKMQQVFSYFKVQDNSLFHPASVLPKINNQMKEKSLKDKCDS